jgi:exodeoxyribonuclease-3
MTERLLSWNVNGVRAAVKKDFGGSLAIMNADVLCLQETKAQVDQVMEALESLDGYYIYANHAEKKGYSGTAILSKKKPINVQDDIGVKSHDNEGRVITAEYDDYYLVTTYVPNSGQGLVRNDYRGTWDKAFRSYLKNLDKHKPVVLCGDLNVAHQPIDLKNPKPNYNKTAGYTQLEIDGFSKHLNAGFVDSFRHLYPEEVAYSWWSYRAGARAKNVGWRLDYFLVSERLMPSVKDSFIMPDVMGSDHCPVGIELGAK